VAPAAPYSRFGGFLTRKASAATEPSNANNNTNTTANANSSSSAAGNTAASTPASESELAAALAKEQNLRQQAEGKVSQMSHELEDLSVQLFQQANEMVATERKARARLEERVEILEKRDVEKRKRLERLENALQRIERVKNLLGGT
jgi:predicted RNase H-like nuclease (RuvC/YqgF family)